MRAPVVQAGGGVKGGTHRAKRKSVAVPRGAAHVAASRGIHHIGRCETTGKQRFESKAMAKTKARRLESTGQGAKVGRMDVYRCDSCGTWHVGHPWGHRRREAS